VKLIYNKKNKNTRNDKILAFVLWFTGLPCSGKSTIAKLLKEKIPNLEILDGDVLVKQLKLDNWSRDSRINHSKKVATMANSFLEQGISVCVSKISPFEEMRVTAKNILKKHQFFEVFVDAPIEICERRDVKGMYKEAREGKLKNFCGVNEKFEIPKNPDLILNTEKFSTEESIKILISFLEEKVL
tara:strand:+ start:125 stop:682 length:558 start_codon:yes stop_codon:yes gene_type:complete